jgi:hypothetical protein
LKQPTLIRSPKQQQLHQYLLDHHKGGATVEEIRVSLSGLDYPIEDLRLNTQIHDQIFQLWIRGFVRSKSQYDDPYKPGLAYWIPTYPPEQKRRIKNGKTSLPKKRGARRGPGNTPKQPGGATPIHYSIATD